MSAFWTSVIHQSLLILIQLFIVFLLFVSRRIVTSVGQWMVHHVNVKERQFLAAIGREAFAFAEQAFAGAGGSTKLQQALAYASGISQKYGLSVTPDELRAAIEAAVLATKKNSP